MCIPTDYEQKWRGKWGNTWSVKGDGDQALAAEPGFRGQTPGGVKAAAISLLHVANDGIGVGFNPRKSLVTLPPGKRERGWRR